MKKITITGILTTIVILMMSINSSAQFGELRGKVTDAESNEPLPFANVVILRDSVKMGAATDIDGNYIIKPVKPGIYDIHVSYIGYKDIVVKDYDIKANLISFQNIRLTPSTLEVKEVMIMTYSKPLVEADEGSGGRLTKSEIRKAPTRHYIDGVKVSAGVIGGTTGVTISDVPQNLSGILTAGELNDFSKWELWKDINKSDLNKMQDYWSFKPFERYTVQVINAKGRPVTDCEVSLMNKENTAEWTCRTDNTGKAELWLNMFSTSRYKKGFWININFRGENYKINDVLKFTDGINIITIPAACNDLRKADVMFVVDATGSMSDEIEYLKSELNNIIMEVKKQHPALELNLGSVFYRDKGDAYVTRKSEFNTDINVTIDFIKEQSAGGGGDEPEAVHTALNEAIDKMKWSDDAVARLMFLVLDAPPHYTPGIIDSLQSLIREAAAKGIRVIPITGSGINKYAEYLMRSFALATNGTYVFLTDHSRVGNPHIKPTTDEYDVHLLKDVLLRIFGQYLFIPDCNEQIAVADQNIRDTMYVKNPKLIAHEIADSMLLGKFRPDNKPVDTNKVSFVDTLQINRKTDSLPLNTQKETEKFTDFRYYPNPTTGRLTIEINGNVEQLFLADISGKLLERYNVKGNEKTEINIGKYPVGIYFLQYNFNNKWLTGKVILTR